MGSKTAWTECVAVCGLVGVVFLALVTTARASQASLVRGHPTGTNSTDFCSTEGNCPMASVGGKLFFISDALGYGWELWRSDGTAAGTRLVRIINPGRGNAYPGSLTQVGRTLYFAADDGVHGRELWRTDSTPPEPNSCGDINPGGGFSSPEALAHVGGTLYFIADDGVHGAELWRSDGTPGEQGSSRTSMGAPGWFPPPTPR